jgi:ribosomal protein L29
MAVITGKTLREKSSQELQDQLMLEKKRLFDGVVKSASGESIKAHEKRGGKRLIARIRSILRERELRVELDKKIADLTPKAEKAAPIYQKLVKAVDERAAAIKKELAKDKGRKVKPMLKRTRCKGEETTVADRAAIRLAEAKRLKASIDREDVGAKS